MYVCVYVHHGRDSNMIYLKIHIKTEIGGPESEAKERAVP